VRLPYISLLLTATFSCALANGGVPELLCRKTYAPPQLDGVLDEPCWHEAHGVTGFALLEDRGFARKQTQAFVLYDDSFLYVGFVCDEPDMDGVRFRPRERDGTVWHDECVEVFIDSDHDHLTYYHIIASISESQYDEMGRLEPWTWNCSWMVSVAEYPDRWTAELAVPFICLGLETPRPGDSWGFNLNREEWQLKERSGWSPTWRDFHEPDRFGHLIFEPES
jgi:hypothetical protein